MSGSSRFDQCEVTGHSKAKYDPFELKHSPYDKNKNEKEKKN